MGRKESPPFLTCNPILAMHVLVSIDWLAVADHAFLVLHTGLILFNIGGWLSSYTRKAHLVCISLTLASWVFLGIWYGWGYCPCTDWHWEILRLRGVEGLPNSYISYLLERILGWAPAAELVDGATLGVALAAFFISLWLNLRKPPRKRNRRKNQ